MKLPIYSREVRDYYNGEEITQYMLAPEAAEKCDYMDTDCLAVSMDARGVQTSQGRVRQSSRRRDGRVSRH